MADRGRPPLLPSLLLGIGFGGFIDGIVLHQILQWHHMLSAEGCCPTSTVLGLEDNTLADGFFHVATWIALMAGTILAMRAWQRAELAPPWGAHVGGLLIGWGGFNLVASARPVTGSHQRVLRDWRDFTGLELARAGG
ncbi:MAG TPA: DUF2243 domain-containing protein [Solirubrobacterales bacterium]|nr:DUF2243 domain-containing protein [Solirubrobacterales bacterium]